MDNTIIVNKIKQLAKEKGVTIKDTLETCELSKSFIYDLEKRNMSPSYERLKRLAEYFNVSTDFLLGNEKSTPIEVHDENDNIVVLDDETLKIIDNLRSRPEMKMLFSVSSKATPEDIIKAVKIIEALRDDSKH